ncbi:MAG: S1 RNA-binding domain-containing protein [Acidobacteria bacterium]|nr:S1 RNA-binding domain-containing protein [Acidobacteriota bacterium]
MNLQNPIDATADDTVSTAGETSFAEILNEYEQQHRAPARTGDQALPALEGTVVSVTPDGVYVDIGRKHEGILTLDQVRDSSGQVRVKPGHTVRVTAGPLDDNGYHKLSTIRIVIPKDWSGFEKAFADKSVITGTVSEVVKGGLRVDVGVRAFLPASRSGARDQAELDKMVGQEIECRITKLDVEKEDVVLDRRSILEERAAASRQAAFDAVQEGVVLRGTVRSLMDFGAFVDLGGVDGLLHVSDMSWTRGVKPSDVVKIGDPVEVKVLKVNRDTRKISLGMKQLQDDPWTVALREIKTGDRVRGKVARVTDFGAFVEIRQGVEGLIHVSEMSWSKKQRRPQDILKPGEMVDAVVLTIKPDDKRIGLGLKQALGDPWEEAVKKYPVGTAVELPVANLAAFGAFLEMAEGVEGLIHIGDITHGKRLQHPKDVLQVGQIVRAEVTEIDQERRRFRLNMKKLEPTSADEYIGEHKVGDLVTGRVVDGRRDRVKIELADGVTGVCRMGEAKGAGPQASGGGGTDLGSLSAMLAAKWKAGSAGSGQAADGLKAGQVRRFRISGLDPGQKRIDLELAD